MILEYIVKNNGYKNINQVLKNEFNISARLFVKLIKNNKVLLNEKPVDTRKEININDKISVLLDLEEDNSNIQPTKMELKIVYEDNAILVVNKPAGIAVHPSILHYTDSLSNGIKYYFDSIKLKKKIRPVNRLDLNTSGLVVFAKNEYIQECLIKQMENGSFKKEYIAIVKGILPNKKGTINAPIARKENSIIERCVQKDGKPSITHYEVLGEYTFNIKPLQNTGLTKKHILKLQPYAKNKQHTYTPFKISIIKCRLETGRTHQIRVHMAYTGHPLLGDTLYGVPSKLIKRQALHCSKLCFIHPISKKAISLECNLPPDFTTFF